MTWADWHTAYDDPESGLSARLRVVQRELRAAIDACAPEPVRLVSVRAGQGHDVVGAWYASPEPWWVSLWTQGSPSAAVAHAPRDGAGTSDG